MSTKGKKVRGKLLVPLLIIMASVFGKDPAATPRCALVLSGGGARGFAQIGVLKALETAGIRPDLIVATSIGAIIGAMYASGYSADSIASLTRTVAWDEIFSNSSRRKTLFVSQKNEPNNALFELRFDYDFKPILPNALSHGQAIYDCLSPLLTAPQFRAGSDFDRLEIPLRIIATDLISGEKVVFSKGNIVTAIRASCALPLAFSPVPVGNTLLIDGGVKANIPVQTARSLGARTVIAVDVTSPLWKKRELANPVRLVDQIVAISTASDEEQEKKSADFVIRPELGNLRNNDFSTIDSLIGLGYAATLPHCPDLRSLLLSRDSSENGATSGTPYPLQPILLESDPASAGGAEHKSPTIMKNDFSQMKDPIISSIDFKGNRRTLSKVLTKSSGLKVGDTLSPSNLKNSLSSLYATDLFENVNIDIDSNGLSTIVVEEKKFWRLRTGLRFDDFHYGEGYVEPAYENCFGQGVIALLHLQYGLRREKYSLELEGNHLSSRNIANNLGVQLYSSKEKIMEAETTIVDSVRLVSTTSLTAQSLRKSGLNLSVGTQLGRYTLVSAGIRLERFRVQQSETEILGDILGMQLKKTLSYYSLKLTMDSMDEYPYPNSGLKLYLSAGGANKALGGRYTFYEWTGSIGRYFTFMERHTIFPRLSFSWASSTLPEIERAYLGGAVPEERYQEHSLYNYVPFSGLPPRAMTGDRFGIAHMEYRCEVKKNLFAHVMTDWGTAWYCSDHDYRELMKEAPIGIGVGVSYLTLVGPIRFLFGRLVRNHGHAFSRKTLESFYFSAGYDF